MKWFNVTDTLISAVGTANRRSVVVMMVLDRSTSMNPSSTNGNHDSCADLKAAAKMFTGQFAIGRDRIGMVSFSDGVGPVYAPSTDFRAALGYNTGTTSGNGAIDQITCNGGTGTAGAITVGYNELYKANLPGAYNILLIETDGLRLGRRRLSAHRAKVIAFDRTDSVPAACGCLHSQSGSAFSQSAMKFLTTLLALGGIWLWAFCAELKKRPLLPINDPFLAEAIAHE